jgi:hypothetical protein
MTLIKLGPPPSAAHCEFRLTVGFYLVAIVAVVDTNKIKVYVLITDRAYALIAIL